jgi:hypothetical protein
MKEPKLAIGAFGFAAGVILVITITPTPKEQVTATALSAVLSPVSSALTFAATPPSSDTKEDKQAEPATITEARVKKAVRRTYPRVARFGKLYQGNGTSGRFSICGEVVNAGVLTPLLYLADTAEVMLFTNPVNERVTVEGYNIFIKDCRG